MTDNRARMANVLSIAQNTNRKKSRREKKSTFDSLKGDLKSIDSNQNSQIVKLADSSQIESKRSLGTLGDDIGSMENPRLFSVKQLEQLGVVHPKSKNQLLVNALRQIRTKLFRLKPDGNFSVLVTSVVPEGGASFIALNLASTITFDKEKTSLLIDTNVSDPVLHRILKLLKIKPKFGLLDYLLDPAIGIENIVSPSGLPRMRIIPIGDTGDTQSEQLTSGRLPGFLDDVKKRYANRFIVVDAPCINESADTRVLADHCDFIILVVPYGLVTPSQIDSVVDDIDDRKLAGIVMNNEPLV